MKVTQLVATNIVQINSLVSLYKYVRLLYKAAIG